MKKGQENRDKASETAYWVLHGVRRAYHLDPIADQYFADQYPLINTVLNEVCPDFPEGGEEKALLSLDYSTQRQVFNSKIFQGYDSVVSTRKMMVREKIKQAIDEKNITQVVFLGAGYDVTSVFIPKSVKVFELDKGSTRQVKIKALQRASKCHPDIIHSIQLKGNVTIVNKHLKMIECDFLEHDIASRLKSHGFNPSENSLIIAEGLTVYLTPQAMESLLKNTYSLMNEQSEFLVGLLSPSFKPSDELKKNLEKSKENYQFLLPKQEIIPYMNRHQFAVTQRCTNKTFSLKMPENDKAVFIDPQKTFEPYYVLTKGKQIHQSIDALPEINLPFFVSQNMGNKKAMISQHPKPVIMNYSRPPQDNPSDNAGAIPKAKVGRSSVHQ